MRYTREYQKTIAQQNQNYCPTESKLTGLPQKRNSTRLRHLEAKEDLSIILVSVDMSTSLEEETASTEAPLYKRFPSLLKRFAQERNIITFTFHAPVAIVRQHGREHGSLQLLNVGNLLREVLQGLREDYLANLLRSCFGRAICLCLESRIFWHFSTFSVVILFTAEAKSSHD